MIHFEQELKKFAIDLDKKQIEKEMMAGKSQEVQNSPVQQNKVDQVIKRYRLAVNYCQTNSYDLAYIQIKKVVRLLPEHVDAQLLAALVCIHEGKQEQARQAIEQVLKLDSNNKTAHLYMEELTVKSEPEEVQVTAEAEQPEGKAEKAEQPALRKKAKKAVPKKTVTPVKTANGNDYEEVTSNKKSFIYLGIGFLIGVVAMFVLVVPTARNSVKDEYVSEADNYKDQLTAKDTEIKSLKEELSNAQADTKAAKEEVQKYKNGDESLIKAANYYNSNNKSEAAKALAGINESVLNDEEKTLYEKIKSATFDKTTASLLFSEGKAHFDDAKYKSAIEELSAAIEADDTNPSYYYWLGRAYEEKGQTKSAKEKFNELIEKFPTSNQAKDAQKRLGGMNSKTSGSTKEDSATASTTEKTN